MSNQIRQGKQCPSCHGLRTRQSQPRGLELLLTLFRFRPHRCRDCEQRFWRFTTVRSGGQW
jgi:hypothetical protein